MPKLITDLAIMLLTAGVVAVIFRRFKQPLVLGYILAGFVQNAWVVLPVSLALMAAVLLGIKTSQKKAA